MTASVKVHLDTKALDALLGRVDVRAERAVSQTTSALRNEIHNAAPADEGELKGSLEELHPKPTRGIVRVNAPHGIHVEYGTSRMKAQPFIRPSAKKVRARFLGEARKVFDE